MMETFQEIRRIAWETVAEILKLTLTDVVSGTASATSFLRGDGAWAQAMPAGFMADYGGTSAPTGWLACDGAAVSRTTFAALFTAIGTTWGVGDGTTTFNVPNFQRRVAVGSGGSGTGTLGNAVGNTGGAETHTLSTAEIPSHTHTVRAQTGVPTVGNQQTLVNSDSATGNNDQPVIASGGGGAHNNMQPSAIVLKIIKT